MMDQNKPARFLDTAYNALKANPNATNQILQAAAKGAPVGLRGLAAAAAQQNQQEAQKAMAAQQMQAQGPQASVIQKLASMPGIMGQLPASMQLASAPTGPAPEEMPPQMMAGGGLVAFAGGGNVLPPDVIDAIQSHFAEGGDVRGYAGGENVEGMSEALRRAFGFGTTDKGASAKEMAELENIISGQRMTQGMEEAAGYDPKRLTLKGPESASLWEENRRLDEIIRKQRAAQPMLEGMARGASPYMYAGEIHYLPETPYVYEGQRNNMPRTPLEHKTLSPEAQAFQSEQLSNAERLANAGEKAPSAPSFRERLNASAGRAGQPFSFNGVSESVGPIAKKTLKTLMGTAGALGSVYETGKTGKELYDIYEDPTMGTQEKAEKGLRSGLRSGLGAIGSSIGGIYGGIPGAMAGGAGGAGLSDKIIDWGERLAGLTPESMEASKYGDINRAITLDELKARQKASGYVPELGTQRYPEEEEESEEFADEPVLKEPVKGKAAVKGAPPVAPPKTWKPEPHDGHEVSPRQQVIKEGTKVDPTFEQVKKDVPSAAVTPTSETSGLNALAPGMDMEKMRDLIMGLGGHKEMTPDMLQQLGDLKDSARTSTILQSALGALAGGLSNPYGGRYALGSAALGALGGYQKGVGSEEEINRKAFDVLRGYADAPEEEKTKARDLLFGQLSKAAELESEERRAVLRGAGSLSLEDRIELAKVKAGLGPNPFQQAQITAAQQLARDRASDNAMREIEDINKSRRANVQPELTEPEKRAIIDRHFAMQGVPYVGGLGAQQSAGQSGGLGGGPLVLK